MKTKTGEFVQAVPMLLLHTWMFFIEWSLPFFLAAAVASAMVSAVPALLGVSFWLFWTSCMVIMGAIWLVLSFFRIKEYFSNVRELRRVTGTPLAAALLYYRPLRHRQWEKAHKTKFPVYWRDIVMEFAQENQEKEPKSLTNVP